MSNYLRQKTIPLSQLPPHPALSQSGASSRPTVQKFVETLVQESTGFISAVLPDDKRNDQQKGWKSIGKKKEADMYETDIGSEYWCCRRSTHKNRASGDSFSWSEIYGCVLERHFESEQEWAPTFKSFARLMDWTDAGALTIPNLSKIELGIFALRHDVSSILKDRLFPLVLLKAQTAPDNFLIVSLALSVDDYKRVTGMSAAEKVVVGRYNSVERVRLLPSLTPAESAAISSPAAAASTDEDSAIRPTHSRVRLPSSVDPTSSGKIDDDEERPPPPAIQRQRTLDSDEREIEMMMAVNSDAGGNIPGFAQKKALPGAVAVDVGAIKGWLANERFKDRISGKGTFSSVEVSWRGGVGAVEGGVRGVADFFFWCVLVVWEWEWAGGGMRAPTGAMEVGEISVVGMSAWMGGGGKEGPSRDRLDELGADELNVWRFGNAAMG